MSEDRRAFRLIELKDAFSLFDRNGNGKISTKDLGNLMSSIRLNFKEMELQVMIHEVDPDGRGFFEFQEFLNMMEIEGKVKELDDHHYQATSW